MSSFNWNFITLPNFFPEIIKKIWKITNETSTFMVQNKFLSNPKRTISQLARNLKYELKTYIYRQLIVIHLLVLKHWFLFNPNIFVRSIYHLFVVIDCKGGKKTFPGSTIFFDL